MYKNQLISIMYIVVIRLKIIIPDHFGNPRIYGFVGTNLGIGKFKELIFLIVFNNNTCFHKKNNTVCN